MDQLPGLAWIKDLQGRYVYVNDAAEKAFRTSRADLYGKTDDMIFPAEIAAAFKQNDLRAVANGAAVKVIETLRHSDGVLHHSLVNKFPVSERPDGKSKQHVGGIAIDITDRLLAEEALREADRRKDEFLATLAHELRNPLAPIRNSLQILRMPMVDAATVRQTTEIMGSGSTISSDWWTICWTCHANYAWEGRPAPGTRVELSAVVDHAVETARPLIEVRGHQLETKLPPESLVLHADPVRLAQVVGNLLNNAAKYTEEKDISGCRPGEKNGEVILRLRDDGIGIASEMLPRTSSTYLCKRITP